MSYVISPIASMRNTKNECSMQINQCLYGEKIIIIEKQSIWSYIKLCYDGYEGWVKSNTIGIIEKPTHSICKNNTIIYSNPSNKSLSIGYLPLGAKIKVKSSNEVWTQFIFKHKNESLDAFVFNENIIKINNKIQDWVAIAESFLNKPYLWGGRSFLGIDCSGLVQISLQSALINFPRDTNLQIKTYKGFTNKAKLRRGSLIFWKGHVGIMINPTHILHANGYHMRVTVEKLETVKRRIKSNVLKFINL